MARPLQHVCFNHAMREAAARCPSCSRFFCRECVTEHDDRVICAACLRRLAPATQSRRRWIVPLRQTAQCLLGALVLWFVFHAIGSMLAAMPHSFHDGTLWKRSWFDH
jgi:hypothetical protein